MTSLSQKQQLFVAFYCESWNATDAARRAGYKDPEQAGYENKRKQEVAAAIQERLDDIMPAGEVLTILADQARGTMADFTDPDTETLDLQKAYRGNKLHLIKKFSRSDTETSTRISVELYDAQAAAVQMGKYHGLFTDKVEHSGMITVERAAQMTDEEIDAELKRRGLL